MKRLLALVVLAAIGVVAYSYWKGRPVSLPSGSSENLGQVGDKLGQVGQTVSEKLQGAGEKVGEKLQGARLTGSVKAALELNRTLKAYPIDVSSEDGTVILRGEVPSEELRAQAGKVAAAVPDVAQVRNELRVNPGLAPAGGGGERTLGENFDDKALETKVRLAFSLNKDLKGTDIDVKSYRREVALSGTVPSEAHRQLAVQTARETTDVLAVRDGLAVGAAAGAPPAGTAPGQPGPGRPPRGRRSARRPPCAGTPASPPTCSTSARRGASWC